MLVIPIMDIQDPDYQNRVAQIFEKAPFLKNLGVKLQSCGPGSCESFLEIQNYHKQQDRLVHAGVVATLADHTAGGAASSLLKPGESVLTVDFHLQLLRAGKGRRLLCKSRVLKSGPRLCFAESEVFAVGEEGEKLIARASVTLAVRSPAADPAPYPQESEPT